VLFSKHKSNRALTKFALIVALTIAVPLASAEKTDTRFQWSYDKFAAQCGFTWPDYHKAHSDFFTDHDYSDKWVAMSLATFKACDTCYRTAEVANVNGVRVAQFTFSSESGDWYYFAAYCFDSAGKLQGLHTVYNSTSWSYVGRYVYSGTFQLQDERFQDLTSGKKISRPNDSGIVKEHWKDLKIYKTVSELPFAKLMTN
jgi:hypothetical protein